MIALSVFLFFTAAHAETITGKITYSKVDPKSPLYFYESVRKSEGEKTISKTKFTDREGKIVVEEESVYEKGLVLKYSFKQNQVNEFGTIESKDGKMNFTFTSQGKLETDEEDIEPNMIVADMIGDHIRKNWDELAKGETIKFRFLLAERLETIGFKIFVDKEREVRGIPAVDIKMKPSSFIIAALTDPLIFTVEKNSPHRILEAFGRLPVRHPKVPNPSSRSDWRAIDALTELEYKK